MPLTQVTTGMIADAAVTPAKLANGGVELGTRNKIINGAMMIDQRNAGASGSTQNGYSTDRWQMIASVASKYTYQQNAGSVTPPAGFVNYLGVTSSSAYTVGASEIFGILQQIEGLNLADLNWGTASAQSVTASFWVRSSLTGTFGGVVRNNGNDRSYPFSYTIAAANTWEYKTVTIPGDTTGTWLTTNGIGIRLMFSIGAGATISGTAGTWAAANYSSATGATSVVGTNGATFYITGVQLEKGSTATSFDYRPYGTELALCQRYYNTSYPAGTAIGSAGSWGPSRYTDAAGNYCSAQAVFPVTMRTTPTVTIYNTINGTAGQVSGDVANKTGGIFGTSPSGFFGYTNNVASGSGEAIRFNYTATAEL